MFEKFGKSCSLVANILSVPVLLLFGWACILNILSWEWVDQLSNGQIERYGRLERNINKLNSSITAFVKRHDNDIRAVKDSRSSRPKAIDAVKYFKEKQKGTKTPHGAIVMSSVEEKDGMIRYKTEDGHMWHVNYYDRYDGTYWFVMPMLFNPPSVPMHIPPKIPPPIPS